MVIATLEKLLDEGKSRILIDTSLVSLAEFIPDKNRFFRSGNWEDITIDELEDFIESAEQYADVLNSDNILVVPEVISEVGRFIKSFISHDKMIRDIKNQLSTKAPNKAHRVNYEPYTRKKLNLSDIYEEDYEFIPHKMKQYGGKKEACEQEGLYTKAITALKTIQHKLNSHVLIVNKPLYSDFIELIKKLNSDNNIKTKPHGKGKYEYKDLYTDEIIVGTALYLAFRDRDRVTIATSDDDLYKLLVASFDLLGFATNGLGYYLQKVLRENPVELYLSPVNSNRNNEAVITTTANLKMPQRTYRGIDMKKTQEVAQELRKIY